jgi:hypothetical protein
MMGNHLPRVACAALLGSTLGATVGQGAETRVQAFTLLCDGTARTTSFNLTGLGASVNRFIQASSFAVTEPRGGIKLLRLVAQGDATKVVLELGAGQTGKHADVRNNSFIQTSTNASGQVPMQVIGICVGGGSMQAFATVWFLT